MNEEGGMIKRPRKWRWTSVTGNGGIKNVRTLVSTSQHEPYRLQLHR